MCEVSVYWSKHGGLGVSMRHKKAMKILAQCSRRNTFVILTMSYFLSVSMNNLTGNGFGSSH